MGVLKFLAPGASGFGGFTHTKTLPSKVFVPETISGHSRLAFLRAKWIDWRVGVKLSFKKNSGTFIRRAAASKSTFVFLRQNFIMIFRVSGLCEIGLRPNL